MALPSPGMSILLPPTRLSTLPPPPEPEERIVAGPPEAVQGDNPVDEVLDEVAEQVDALEGVVDVEPLDHPRRLLLVHAHPDDETIGTGATMAKYAAENALVTL